MSPIRLVPNRLHPITIQPTGRRVVVRAGGRVVADSADALTLQESSYPPVQYIPIADVDPSVLTRSDTRTYCPYKGHASYYSLLTGDDEVPDALWTYEQPYPAVAQIAGHVAFYPNRVEIIVTDDVAETGSG
jgi:uncharacterized protein (DUF427 family)